MGAPSKRARKIREAGEFDLSRLINEINPPRANSSIFAWSLADIFAARNQQMLGRFRLAARLAESMRTDDALAVAYENRLAPQRCIKVEIKPVGGARGVSVANEAEALFGQNGIGVKPDTLSDLVGCLANHGVAFAKVTPVPRDDGSRVDMFVNAWPIEWVYWDPTLRAFRTQTETQIETITHGDGRWIIFQKHEIEPWKNEACILAGSIVWARHAFAGRDWTKGSTAHGSAKAIGEMPAGVPLQGADGKPTAEAAAMLALMKTIATGDAPAGLRPSGAKTDFLTNTSTAWQVWAELMANAERAAARIYLGTDGTLGAVGGAPGVDIAELFGVATTRVAGDLGAIERGLATGVIEPWTAVNFGDSSLAPSRCYLVPDKDAEAARLEKAKKWEMFFARMAALRANGFMVTPVEVQRHAEECGLENPPTLSPTQPQISPVSPAPQTIQE